MKKTKFSLQMSLMKMKSQATNQDNICKMYVWQRILDRMYKEILQHNKRKWEQYLNRHIRKEIYE